MIPSLYYSQTVVVTDGYASEYYGEYVTDSVNSVVAEKAVIRLKRNDAYDGTANPVKSFTVATDFSVGWTGTLTIRHRVTEESLLSVAVSVASSTVITASMSSTDTVFALLTSNEDFGPHPFDIQMISGSSRQTPINGIAIITKDQTLT